MGNKRITFQQRSIALHYLSKHNFLFSRSPTGRVPASLQNRDTKSIQEPLRNLSSDGAEEEG